MRDIDILRLLTPLLVAVAMAVVTVRRRLVSTLRRAGATSHAHAVAPPALGPIGSWQLRHLVARGVVRTADGRVYLDEPRFADDQRARRRRALAAATVATVLGAALVVLARLGGR